MKKENLYLSTIAPDAVHMAKEYGIHLEIAEYCTAWNMDEKFGGVDQVVRKKLDGISQSVLHAPFWTTTTLSSTSAAVYVVLMNEKPLSMEYSTGHT